ncbi:6-hydroxy-D-nicotine oxidase [Cyphellophora attinorum]|uniref:6-hydroxy-D-nicotine oxidase n=1 Tax=Cyphellophora attinorum TaxID=1664694 RepID=A0A0N1HHA6_9EURO|nr:6-hydroxy-D-nicotine oxidase [Phialophora attinorum]KPI45304.1 6-hydroxy-D-nicotine oxidase [Phialophora attinorum]
MATTLDQLRNCFKGFIIEPHDQHYSLFRKRWSINEEANPKVILQPLSEADVSAAVKYAVGQGLEIAVNVGGHSFVGASSSDGVIIDLRRMNTVYVTNSGYGTPGTVTLEGGTLTGEVAQACEESGVFVSIPSHKELGYAGFALGTGAGWGMGVWGLAIDNLISARLVLASGDVIEVSETSNPELFWGVFFGSIVYPVEQYEAVFNALDKYNATQKDDDMVFLVLLPHLPNFPNAPPEAILLIPYYHGDDVGEARKRFSVFFDVPHVIDDTRLMWFHETADQFPEALWPRTHRLSNGTLVTRVEPDVFLPVVDRLRQWFSAKPDRRPGSSLFVGMYNWRKTMKPASNKTSAWPPSREQPGDGYRLWKDVAVYLGYDDSEETPAAVAASNDIITLLRKKHQDVVGKDVIKGMVYPNAGVMPGSTGEYMYKDNYPRLQDLKRKYDSTNVFHKKHPIKV